MGKDQDPNLQLTTVVCVNPCLLVLDTTGSALFHDPWWYKGAPQAQIAMGISTQPSNNSQVCTGAKGPLLCWTSGLDFLFYGGNSSCQVKEESGLSQDKDDSAASIFYPRYRVYICEYSFHYVFLFRRVQMFSYNLFCPGKLSGSLEVSLSFWNISLLLEIFILSIWNSGWFSVQFLVNTVYYNWNLMRALCSGLPGGR